MVRKSALRLISLALLAGLLSCGPSEEELMLTQFQEDLQLANAAIDSLHYTIESSNLLIDELRTHVDSTQHVNEQLLASVQKLSREVREWRQLATQYRQNNERLTAEIETLKTEKLADQQTIATLRSQADSLGAALLESHTSIRRQSDQLRNMEIALVQTKDQVEELQKARSAVNLLVATEDFLKDNGYLDTSRPLGRAFRKDYQLIKRFEPNNPAVRLVDIGESILLDGKLNTIVDRYGKLKAGDDYRVQREGNQVVVTFVNDLLGGVDLLAIIE